jgi:hypothetical protein
MLMPLPLKNCPIRASRMDQPLSGQEAANASVDGMTAAAVAATVIVTAARTALTRMCSPSLVALVGRTSSPAEDEPWPGHWRRVGDGLARGWRFAGGAMAARWHALPSENSN